MYKYRITFKVEYLYTRRLEYLKEQVKVVEEHLY
jgi:hypothetical protein